MVTCPPSPPIPPVPRTDNAIAGLLVDYDDALATCSAQLDQLVKFIRAGEPKT